MYKKRKITTIPMFIGLAFNLAIPQFTANSIKNTMVSSYESWVETGIFEQKIDKSVLALSDGELATLQGHALVQQTNPYTPVVASSRVVVITAYSSTVDQTDSTPLITALGTDVRDGIIACNFLKFGTKVRIPSLFGDKVFVVEDRMALKNSHKIDIWFETREQAKQFGIKVVKVEVLEI